MHINSTQSAIFKPFYEKCHIEYTQIQTYRALPSELRSNIFMIENNCTSSLPGQSSKVYQREKGFESLMTRPLGYFNQCHSHLHSREYCPQTRRRVSHLFDRRYLPADCQNLINDHVCLVAGLHCLFQPGRATGLQMTCSKVLAKY